MKQADNMKMVLAKGTKVEVKCDEKGLRGAWYEAIILKPPTSSGPNCKAKVIYTTLLANDGVRPLWENVLVTNIRPVPPVDETVRPFEVHDVVDAHDNDGWWEGVVISVREVNEEKKYKVLFENPPEEIEYCASKLRVHLDWIDNMWVKPPNQNEASLISSCQGQYDDLVDKKERKNNVAVQLGSAEVLNNSCENPLNYYAVLNSKFKRAKRRRACKSKAESSYPCKKFRGKNSATECHEKSAPLEQLFGDKVASCMLPEYSSNPETGILPSVESMSLINSGTNEEEATMEADMTTSVDKSLVPENSELKSQQISASGCDQNTAEYVATSSLLNSFGNVIVDRPQDLCSEGEKDNRKGVSKEMLAPQLSADFIAGVNVVISGGMLMDDQCQFLCSEGHCHCNTQNQCNDVIDGQSVPGNGIESSVEADNEPVENVEIPFIKSPHLWRFVDSLEIFKVMPQNPHFRPLINVREALREGFAIGYMMTFSTVVEKISELLQFTDSQNKFDDFLETVAELELHGFRVKPLVDRINTLLSMKDEHRRLENQSKEVKAQLADRTSEQVRLNATTFAIDKVLSELKKERGLYVLLEKNNSRDIKNLKQNERSIHEGILAVMSEFKSLVAASW